MTGEIKHLRLINGEELISELQEVTPLAYRLITPLYATQNADGETILMRWAPYNKSSLINLKAEHVLTCTDVHQEMRRHYYLSLKATDDYEKSNIDALRQANNDLEKAMVSPRRKRSATAPGSNMKH